MASIPERNDGRKGHKSGPRGRPHRRPDTASEDWIWGWHAVEAALGNARRQPPELILATPERARQIETGFGRQDMMEIVDQQEIARSLPQNAVHQGVAMKAGPLEPVGLDEFEARPGAVILMLDQVTDPQNVGAILRSAAAFGAAGVVLQDRHAPRFTGALAKAAAGALEQVAVARVVNLSRALEELSDLGWRAVGLTGAAGQSLEAALDGSPTVLVLGSEGDGMRRLVSEHCDDLASIPMPGGFESLNVSAAAAIALYEASRPR